MNKLNLFGPMTARTGYGVYFTNLARELVELMEITITPKTQIDPELPLSPKMMEAVKKAGDFFYNSPSLSVWYPNLMQDFVGRTRIGLPFFETNKLNESEAHHLNSLDYVFATSEWGKEVIENAVSRQTKVFNVGGGYNPEVFNLERIVEIKEGLPRPYAISMGKWEVRKSQLEIIEALGKIKSPMTLFALWNNPFWPNWLVQAETSLSANGFTKHKEGVWSNGYVYVFTLNTLSSHYDVARLIKTCDFGIYPHKSEGYGLPGLETMACGVPIISTNYSAPVDYLDPEGCVLLIPESMGSIWDPRFFPQGRTGKWALIDVEQLTDAIQMLIKFPEEHRKSMGNKAAEAAAKHTWKHVAAQVVDTLDEIHKEPSLTW